MKRLLCSVVLAVAFFSLNNAWAEGVFRPSRVILLVHGGLDVRDNVRLAVRFIPSGNLIGELAPISYLGVKLKVASWLNIEGYAGYAFKKDEPFVSLTFNPAFGKLWSWTETDVRLPSWDGYWFAQVDYQLLDWLHAGIEGDGWGNYENGSSWSYGVGPNLLFRFGTVGVDTALHIRKLDDSAKPEFFMRIHLFL